MLKIGAFSKLAHIPIKTLRYYDQRDILKPSMIDQASGYRYYTATQLLTIRKIQAWKEHGFTLDQIKTLLQADITLEEAADSLEEKQTELQHTVVELQSQLTEINTRLSNIQQEKQFLFSKTPVIKQTNDILVASIREFTSKNNLCLLLDELKQYVQDQGADTNNNLIVQWFDSFPSSEKPVDMEVAIPLSKTIQKNNRVNVYQISGFTKALSFIDHSNPYHHTSIIWDQLKKYMDTHQLTIDSTLPIREIYLTGDKEVFGDKRKTELLVPIC
jgi:DNA-binding transcriptional MerR regulator